jgi:hypothetical protein
MPNVVSHEFQFVTAMLYYIQARVSSSAAIQEALDVRSLKNVGESNVGVFLNLNCGHNNSFSENEKHHLNFWLTKALNNQSELV